MLIDHRATERTRTISWENPVAGAQSGRMMIGTVHGSLAATLRDSVPGSAIHILHP